MNLSRRTPRIAACRNIARRISRAHALTRDSVVAAVSVLGFISCGGVTLMPATSTAGAPQKAMPTGSGPGLVATDGQAVASVDPKSIVQTLKASGAHDIGCPIAQVTGGLLLAVDIWEMSSGSTPASNVHYVAEGCGQRATYIWPTPTADGRYNATLVGLVPIRPTAPAMNQASSSSPSPAPTPGPSAPSPAPTAR
jgi:hypothetical protein